MALVNEHFLKLPGSYLFSDIAKKVNTFRITHPKQEVIRLGIGDVTRPLPPACIEAMHKAVEEMADARTFRGYGPEQGYDFLIEAIIKHDYLPRGIHFGPTEIFVNDGATFVFFSVSCINDSFSSLKRSSIILFFSRRLIHTPPSRRQTKPAAVVMI